MIFETEEYKVTSDKHQFTLYSLSVVEAGEGVAPEKVGTVKSSFIGHYPKFDMLVRGAIKHELSNQSVLDLDAIHNHIEAVAAKLEGVLR